MSLADWNWDAIRRHCYAEARRLGRSHNDAEDVAQEAALRAWRNREACRDPARPWAWVEQITRNETYRLFSRAWHDPRAPNRARPRRPNSIWRGCRFESNRRRTRAQCPVTHGPDDGPASLRGGPDEPRAWPEHSDYPSQTLRCGSTGFAPNSKIHYHGHDASYANQQQPYEAALRGGPARRPGHQGHRAPVALADARGAERGGVEPRAARAQVRRAREPRGVPHGDPREGRRCRAGSDRTSPWID